MRPTQPQLIITSAQPFSPTSFTQKDVLALRHDGRYHNKGFPHSSDSRRQFAINEYDEMNCSIIEFGGIKRFPPPGMFLGLVV